MTSRVAFMLRALSYPNYRLFFGGQVVSLIGSWISTTATGWLVYRLTGRRWHWAWSGSPGRFLASSGAVRRRVSRSLGPTSCARGDADDIDGPSFALAALTFSGHITVPAMIVLNVVQGMVNAFDMPAGRRS